MKKLTVMGIMGNTQGVTSEMAPQRMPFRMNVHRSMSGPFVGDKLASGGEGGVISVVVGGAAPTTGSPARTVKAASRSIFSGGRQPASLHTITVSVAFRLFFPGAVSTFTVTGRSKTTWFS